MVVAALKKKKYNIVQFFLKLPALDNLALYIAHCTVSMTFFIRNIMAFTIYATKLSHPSYVMTDCFRSFLYLNFRKGCKTKKRYSPYTYVSRSPDRMLHNFINYLVVNHKLASCDAEREDYRAKLLHALTIERW